MLRQQCGELSNQTPRCRRNAGLDCQELRRASGDGFRGCNELRVYRSLGRPRISEKLEKRIRQHLRAGHGILKVAREVGVGTGTVHRIAREMGGPFDAAA